MAILAPIFSAAHVAQWEAHDDVAQSTVTRYNSNDSQFPRIADEGMKTNWTRWRDTDGPHVIHSSAVSDGVFSEAGVPVRSEFGLRGVVAVAERRELDHNIEKHVKQPSKLSHAMPVKTHTWVTLWFLLTAPVIFWDVGYCFMRPRSMVGGDLHWIWKPYEIYQEVDFVYGVKALEDNDGFTNAQSLLNVIETLMNLSYVYLAHVSAWPAAPLVGFAAATMTLSKTVLYWLQEYYCGGCATGHNSFEDLLVYWIIPNGFWIIVPSAVVWQLGKDIVGALTIAERSSVKAASGKSL